MTVVHGSIYSDILGSCSLKGHELLYWVSRFSSQCQMWQWVDQHRMVQIAWIVYQHGTWHAQLNPQGALEPAGLLHQYCRS